MQSALRDSKRIKIVKLASVAALCAGLGALGGCGGSASSTASTQTVHQTPAQSNPDVGSASAQTTTTRALAAGGTETKHPSTANAGGAAHRNHGAAHSPGAAQGNGAGAAGSERSAASRDRVSKSGKVQKARPTPSSSNDDVSSTGAKPINPCTLVSKTEAASITGEQIAASIEAPLGPTCIYMPARSRSDITLAVELQSFSQATQRLRKRTQVTVGTRRGYCGRLGTEMLFVPLAAGQVLHITAPCAVAQRFATLAISRLTA
jgi:hypothetical protein